MKYQQNRTGFDREEETRRMKSGFSSMHQGSRQSTGGAQRTMESKLDLKSYDLHRSVLDRFVDKHKTEHTEESRYDVYGRRQDHDERSKYSKVNDDEQNLRHPLNELSNRRYPVTESVGQSQRGLSRKPAGSGMQREPNYNPFKEGQQKEYSSEYVQRGNNQPFRFEQDNENPSQFTRRQAESRFGGSSQSPQYDLNQFSPDDQQPNRYENEGINRFTGQNTASSGFTSPSPYQPSNNGQPEAYDRGQVREKRDDSRFQHAQNFQPGTDFQARVNNQRFKDGSNTNRDQTRTSKQYQDQHDEDVQGNKLTAEFSDKWDTQNDDVEIIRRDQQADPNPMNRKQTFGSPSDPQDSKLALTQHQRDLTQFSAAQREQNFPSQPRAPQYTDSSLSYSPQSNIQRIGQGQDEHVWKIKAIESNDSDINRVLGKLKRTLPAHQMPVVTTQLPGKSPLNDRKTQNIVDHEQHQRPKAPPTPAFDPKAAEINKKLVDKYIGRTPAMQNLVGSRPQRSGIARYGTNK